MFVRSKTVKDKKYGYLVENNWKKGKVKQVVKKYLGRIIFLDDFVIKSISPINFSLNLKNILQQIISQEFMARNFIQGRGEVYKWNNIVVNLTKGTIKQEDKSVVLYLNGRYLYPKLLRDLLDFFAPESEEDVKGEKLAQAFSDAGISISQEVFIQLYKKIYLSNSSK